MKPLRHLLTAVLLAALSVVGAGAQGPAGDGPTYRIVGPDGRVTFSDRKPTDPQLKTRQLGQTVTAPLVSPVTQPFDLHPATTLPPVARPSANDGLAPPLDISGRPFPPGLTDAVLDVVVHQFFVQTMMETCIRLRPQFTDRYQGGVRNWRDRNVEILDKSNHILFTRFTGEQRDTLRATGRARMAQLIPSRDLPEAERVSWCDHASTDLARRQFELVGDLRVAPILFFQTP